MKKTICITIDSDLHKKATKLLKKYTFVQLSTQIQILLDEWVKKTEKEHSK